MTDAVPTMNPSAITRHASPSRSSYCALLAPRTNADYGWSEGPFGSPATPKCAGVRPPGPRPRSSRRLAPLLLVSAAVLAATALTVSARARQAERDQGLRAGPTSDDRERIKALEREVRELRQANEILRKASAYFAQAELDRRPKP